MTTVPSIRNTYLVEKRAAQDDGDVTLLHPNKRVRVLLREDLDTRVQLYLKKRKEEEWFLQESRWLLSEAFSCPNQTRLAEFVGHAGCHTRGGGMGGYPPKPKFPP